MLTATRPNPQRQAVGRVKSIPSPVGGLNARDALADMKETDAVVLDNFFPEANYVSLRRGHSSYATGMTQPVQTLMTYHALNGSEKLFAAANSAIWDVTVAGAASSSYSTSITSNKWQWINFSNSGNLYLLAVNGSDTPLKYDGSSWATNSITGSVSSSANLINIFQHKERVWLVEKDTLDLWYLSSQAISGAATKFPLGGVFNNGGQIIAGGTLSFDAGAGIDDYLVAITDNGEAAVYSGTNPASASDWALVGVFEIGLPMGPRCLVKIGGDLVILTTKGAVPMSQMIKFDRAQADLVAITAKIQDLFNAAARNYKSNFGWQAMVYAKARYVIFNVPENEGVIQRQYVQNVTTGAWCRFTGMNANCWGILNDELYFGGNAGIVYKADTGTNDDGAQIPWDVKTAFTDCGSPGQNKMFTGLRPLLLTSGTATMMAGINVDFNTAAPTGTISANAGNTALWGSGHWGVAKWGGLNLLVRKWLTVGGIGTNVAARLKGAALGISVQLNGFDVLYQRAQGQVF